VGGTERVTADGFEVLRALVDALPFDLWLRDREQVCVYANPFAVERWPGLVGSKPEDAGGSPEIIAIWRSNNDRAMAGEIVRGEVDYVLDGRRRTLINFIAPVTDAGGAILGTAGVNLDVTDLRDREQQVQRLQALVQGLFDNAPIAIGLRAVRGEDLVHLADNPKTGELLGIPVEALRGRSDREIGVAPDEVQRALSRFRRARAANRSIPFEVSYEFAGGPRTLVGRVAPLPDEDGEERYVFFGEDVTETRALEASLMHADRLASLGTMAAGIAHEINNPLTFVQASLNGALHQLEAAVSHGDLDQRLAFQVLEEIRTAAVGVDRITLLVREMLALARPHRPGPTPTTDVALTVESVVGLAASRLRGVAVVERDIAPLPPVAADAMKLGQVLLNLLTNAAQAIEEGAGRGHVWIRGRLGGEQEHVVLTIEDDGPGIPPSLIGQLFAPFRTGRADGHGLGLFLCRRLVTEMGGTIEAGPREGGGTIMRIELRLASPRTAVA